MLGQTAAKSSRTEMAVSTISACLLSVLLQFSQSQAGIPHIVARHETRLAAASSEIGSSAHPEGESGDINLLDAADKLAIRFRGYPELTGEYRVSADRTISIPVIGRIPLSKLTLADLENNLSKRVFEVAGKEGYVTVEISSYRPFYVVGQVKNPGAIQWQPGLSVLQAVALSGGTAIPLPQKNQVTGIVEELSRAPLQRALDVKMRALAKLARLRAENLGETEVKIPDELSKIAGPELASELVSRETAILLNEKNSFESQREILEKGIGLANQELEGLNERKAFFENQIKLRRQYSAKIAELLSNAPALQKDRMAMEDNMRMLDLEEKSTNVRVAIAQVQSSLVGLNRDLTMLSANRESGRQLESANIERELAQANIEIDDERAKIGVGPGQTTAIKTIYQITRKSDHGPMNLAADESSSLEPGDVLIVNLER
jgi:exopolysaccharide production protein ExoF